MLSREACFFLVVAGACHMVYALFKLSILCLFGVYCVLKVFTLNASHPHSMQTQNDSRRCLVSSTFSADMLSPFVGVAQYSRPRCFVPSPPVVMQTSVSSASPLLVMISLNPALCTAIQRKHRPPHAGDGGTARQAGGELFRVEAAPCRLQDLSFLSDRNVLDCACN